MEGSMNKNVLYYTNEYLFPTSGIAKKIIQQKEAMMRIGYNVDLVSRGCGCAKFNDDIIFIYHYDIVGRLLYNKKIKQYIKNRRIQYSYIYIRNPGWAFPNGFLTLLSWFKNKTKIILEIPTYPYKSEIKTVYRAIMYMLYSNVRRKIKKYIHLIVYMGNEGKNNIWGVRAYQIGNGFDPYSVKINNRDTSIIDINFIGVARLTYWHGYDRLINGLVNYIDNENKYKIKFYIIGDGDKELSRLKAMIKYYSLEDIVFLCGPLYGDELDLYYKKSNICVDSLGRHRTGLVENSSLKSKEYISRGMPVIKSHKDKDLDDLPFVFNVTSDEAPVNIKEILFWYKNIKNNTEDIRKYAIQNFTWDKKMCQILK
jgi:glycosyltransferase involved in cell wall biosynthesis